jgi:hypothetical protein
VERWLELGGASSGAYYITTVTYARLRVFTRPSFIIPLIDSLDFYRHKQQFK